MSTFITSDWHLGDTRLKSMHRPFANSNEMLDVMVRNHNFLVSPNDLVYVLGDVCNKDAPDCLESVNLFNGRKILVRGNHDRQIQDKDFLKYFEDVIPEGQGIDLNFGGVDCFLTHYPTLAKTERFNLVGHIHSAWKLQLNSLNVGVDVHHFYPISTLDVVKYYESIHNFYDNDAWAAYIYANMSYLNSRGVKSSRYNKEYD